jgi:hypothetical protein
MMHTFAFNVTSRSSCLATTGVMISSLSFDIELNEFSSFPILYLWVDNILRIIMTLPIMLSIDRKCAN